MAQYKSNKTITGTVNITVVLLYMHEIIMLQ